MDQADCTYTSNTLSDTTKTYQMSLGEEATVAIKAIAECNGLSLDQAVRLAVTNEAFLLDLERSGHRLIIARPRRRWVRWLFGEPRYNYLNRVMRYS
jgi:hypothetical protein